MAVLRWYRASCDNKWCVCVRMCVCLCVCVLSHGDSTLMTLSNPSDILQAGLQTKAVWLLESVSQSSCWTGNVINSVAIATTYSLVLLKMQEGEKFLAF